MDFQETLFQLDFFVCLCLLDSKFKTEEVKLHLIEIISLYGFYCGWL